MPKENAEAVKPADKDTAQYKRWVRKQIGPRTVGGQYRSHNGGETYSVLAIEPGPRDSWPVWQITVLDDGATEPKSHCTAWNDRDQVLFQPET